MQCSYRILFLQRGNQFTESITSLELQKPFSGLLIRFIHLKTKTERTDCVAIIYHIIYLFTDPKNIFNSKTRL